MANELDLKISDESSWFKINVRNVDPAVLMIYLLALVIRLVLAGLFIDQDDAPVFFETANDIINEGTSIYYEGSLQNKFNYFPLAYLAILPGLYVYYLLGLDNLILQRIFLKLPLIFAELLLAWLLARRSPEKARIEDRLKIHDQWFFTRVTRVELFILFNPLFLYSTSVKGQFDVIPTLFLLLAWRYFLEKRLILSGFLAATSILFKQYGVIVSFYLGINILKKDYRKFPRFVFGHLLISVPVLGIAAYLNYDGLIDHALLYHLNRLPSGISLTSLVYWPVKGTVEFVTNQSWTGILVGNVILVIFKMLLIYVMLYLGNMLWQTENASEDVMRIIIYAFLAFFILNNVLWEQYFIALFVLWAEFKNEKKQIIHEQALYWIFATVPLVIPYRLSHSTPPDVQILFGENWFDILWFTFVLTHFFIMLILYVKKKPMFTNSYVKWLYRTLVLLLPVHYLFFKNFCEVIDFFITAC